MRFSVSAIALLCLVGFVRSNSLAKLKRDTGDELPTISIVGGTEAAAGEFPFLTVLHLNGILCGGTLIGPRHVLTAAHCLYGFSATAVTSFIVFANTLSVYGSGTGTVTSGVSKFIIHQNYNPKIYGNDVALLVLKTNITTIPFISLPTDPAAADMTNITVMQPTTAKPITTTKPTITKKPTTTKPTTTMKPRTTKSTLKTTVKTTLKSTVKAPVRAFSTYENATAVIAGWGTTSSVKGGSVSQVLLKANVTVLANSVCSRQYGSAFVGANQLCASAPGKDTCQGDSGGPIIANGVQIGITSFGASCALSDYAGVYTRVSTYVGWIATTRAKNP